MKVHPTGRTLECDAGSLTLRRGDTVMIAWSAGETGRRSAASAGSGSSPRIPELDDGRAAPLCLATVTVPSADRPVHGPLVRAVRRADDRDRARAAAQRTREADALVFARDRARARQLGIKVFRAELTGPGAGGAGQTGAGERLMVYFSSDQRVDFRELVRDLAGRFQVRIELRQVGVRDEAKMVGGIGSCGRELCCTTFLPQFAPVTIRTAKNQNLALNPSKVSGQCGRLKCCLVYEEAMYVEAARALPRVGRAVVTPEGPGRVEDVQILTGKIRVSLPDRPGTAVFDAHDLRPPPTSSGD